MKLNYFLIGLVLFLLLMISGCRVQTPTSPIVLTVPQLKYRIIANFPDIFWCDPDLYPVGRPELDQAIAQFDSIKSDQTLFAAIIEKLGLSLKPEYSNDEKLQIYREYKKLTYMVQLEASGDVYQFTVHTGQGNGETVVGNITKTGTISIQKRSSSVNTCPICLAAGTIIDTPEGQMPVETIRVGMPVWTWDLLGNKIAGFVLQTSASLVPADFHIVRITLSDGRSIAASPSHPTSTGRPLIDYEVGEILDNSVIITKEITVYDHQYTFDLLPSGDTGFYRANGVLLKSTLSPDIQN
jgi:hypothetical protein